MALKDTFLANINTLIKLKVPPAQFPDAQGIAGKLDDVQGLNEELLDIKKKALELKKQAEAKQGELEKVIAAVKGKIPTYDTNRENLLKVMTKDKNAAGIGACNGLGVALNQMEGYTKDPIGLKFSIEVKG
jgi:hypothetical protein